MYSSIITNFVVLLLVLIFLPFSLYADPTLSLGYTLQVESHKNEDDQVYSDFEVQLVDDYASNRLSANYDLTYDYIYEHLGNDNNTQWDGFLTSSYNFTRSLSLNLDLGFTEISSPDSTEITELNSQTFSTLSSGLEYVLEASIRGSFNISIFTHIYKYDESILDGRENIFEMSYVYPLNPTTDITARYSLIDQKYDEDQQSLDDAIIDRLGIEYQKRYSQLIIDVFIEQNRIDYSRQIFADDIEGYGIDISYDLNSYTRLVLSTSNRVEQAFSTNGNNLDPQNPILESGLVENDTTSLQYEYQTDYNRLLLRIYQTEIRNVTQHESEKLEGAYFNFSREVNEKVTVALSHDKSENQQSGNQFELTAASINYLISETRKTSSAISLRLEEGEENDISRDDSIIQYVFTGQIY